jgi:lipopolysaccharide transport system ATP-binding protein
MNTVIKVENLSKKYIISHQRQERYTALRDVMAKGFKRMFNRGIVQVWKRHSSSSTNQQFNDLTSASLSSSTAQQFNGLTIKQSSSSTTEEFWALKDINFEVKRGERVGIIGRNGAGKTTLLKLLSRITEPTTGRITLKGRVASLLEVGTGFHPELTGRENIFLNGAILGMSKVEIKKKFDEIVDFAEIEKFLDTPVKRYSSGMYVRLAFAVAAHLEPEILIVDEVLAVGDAQFQKKCLGKMEDVSAKEGRTVLFVSHNMGVIGSLCNSGLLLDKGKIIAAGTAADTIRNYELMALNSFSDKDLPPGTLYSNNAIESDNFEFVDICFVDNNGNPVNQIKTFDNFTIRIKFNSPRVQKNGSVAVFIQTVSGVNVLRLVTRPDSCLYIDFKHGINTVFCHIKKLPLPSGQYLMSLGLAIPMREWLLYNNELCKFSVERADINNSGFPPLQEHALSVVDYEWQASSQD